MLSIKGLCKSYDGQVRRNRILNSFDAQLCKRSCLIGANGSGKSTILLAISGLISIDAGQIYWENTETTAEQRRDLTAIASDSVLVPEFLTPRQVFDLNQSTWKCPWPTDLIEQFNFAPHIDKTIDALSAGNLKKLQLIGAFMRKPSILLLDEANIALDEKSVHALWQITEQYEGHIIVASNEPRLFAEKGYDIIDIQGGNISGGAKTLSNANID